MTDFAYALLCFLFVPIALTVTFVICTVMEWIARATCGVILWIADHLL